MLACFIQDGERLAPAQCPQSHDIDPSVVWLDLLNPTPEEVAAVETYMGIAIPTRAQMAEIELSDRLYQEDGAVYMTMTGISTIDEDFPVKAPVTFVLKDDRLVTVRHKDLKSFRIFAKRAQKAGNLPTRGGEMALLGILEMTIDRRADLLERVGDELDGISHAVFRARARSGSKERKADPDLQKMIETIGLEGDLLTKLQESLVSLGRVVAYYSALERRVPDARDKERKHRAKLIARDATALGEHTNFLSSKVDFLLSASLGLISLEQNQIIKIFSVASVVMLPPTLVASAYGMNFRLMPELDWSFGYPFALGLMVVSAVLPYLYFKRRGWL